MNFKPTPQRTWTSGMSGSSTPAMPSTPVYFTDSANLDAFSRLRVSNPQILFNCQFTYDLAPVLYEQITSGVGSTITHNTTNRVADMAFSATPSGGTCYMQTYEYIPYQPGRSQLIFVTFNMQGGTADVLKFAGYSDGTNGIEFQLNGTTAQFTVYSGTSLGSVTKTQTEWNLDKLNGTGASGLYLDLTKTQILVIDFQALYVGRVRVGFDIGGEIVYAHEFLNANVSLFPYAQTVNLPVRCGMTCSATVSSTMYFVCSSVISEGGEQDANVFGYSFVTTAQRNALDTGPSAIIALRPKTTFQTFVNRVRVAYIDIEIFDNGNQPVFWQLVIGQAITGGSWSDVNSTYSSVEKNTTGTLSGTPAIVIDSGWASSSGSAKVDVNQAISSRYPITLSAAGLHRDMGTLVVLITSLSSTQSTYCAVKFREIR